MKRHTKHFLTSEHRRLSNAIQWMIERNWGKICHLQALMNRKRRIEQRIN